MAVEIVVMKAVNADNEACAQRVRARLTEAGVLGINMMSSPGSGKTTLLEATFKQLAGRLRFAVIEGDVYTARDAERIAACGVPALQVNTQGSCHMTAHMVEQLLPKLDLDAIDVLVIENIGNLICPASFSLGEHRITACLSAAEGADKVEKYPKLFQLSHANVITKTDLIPHLEFDLAAVTSELEKLNPAAPVIQTSAKASGEVNTWCEWLQDQALHL